MHRWNGGGCAKTRNTEQEKGEKIAGQESSLCLEKKLAASAKQARGADGSAEEEEMAATKNEDYEGFDEEDQI